MSIASRRLAIALVLLPGAVALRPSASASESVAKEVIAAAEARNHVDQNCTVEMTVRSSKNAAHKREYYLDSEEDFRDEKNLALVISYDHADVFKQAGVDDPAEHYKGKLIRVTGKVIRENEQVRIRVEDPKQIQKVLAATEARNHVGETGVFEMSVQSTKNAPPKREYYLDSEVDFRDQNNLALVISYDHIDLFKQAGINDPAEHYKGKLIRVTGPVVRENEQVRIRVEDPKQIQLVGEGGNK
ncbi:MAG: hypothetical protein P4L84_37570 [Isosphaeraceae bacterium]|nr:hypothetical protein [Isosphaeraceae bacterium]